VSGSAGRISRRGFVTGSLVAGAGIALSGPRARAAQAPAIITASGRRPLMPQGVACGDPGGGRAVIWSRADRPARMVVEYATSDRFTDVRRVRGPAALETSDFTARTVLADLPAGQRIFYRVQFQDLSDLSQWSEPATGSFSTGPAAGGRDVTLAWSADTVGQGWGINEAFGGLKLYDTMRQVEPDLFVHCGDTIYADQPLVPEVPLDDGTVWRNVVTPAKQKVAETIDEFRGNYQYNLLDAHMRRFNAEVGQTVIWDDHELRDNWYETRDLSRDQRYAVKSAALLAARARQAFFEYNPLPLDGDRPERIHRVVSCGPLVEVFALDLRSYRGPNSANVQPALTDKERLFGVPQLDWLKAKLAASRAVWKVIASDLPIGLVVPDGPEHFEAIANREAGPPLGRELEIAELLRFMRDRAVRNVVWITGDVHYAAAHHYDPARARFADFEPFWEFVAGPLHAGTFGPNALDLTFGPEVRFNAVPERMTPNRPPSAGLQFFGTLRASARTRVLTVGLHDLSGRAVYQVELEPAL
jgi:alkaline phosphatase D